LIIYKMIIYKKIQMKIYILKKSSLVFATLLFFSCNDEFLQRYPLDEISNETFWNTENDLMVYNNSLYNLTQNDAACIMLGHTWGRSIWRIDGFTDNIAPLGNVAIVGPRYALVRSGKHSVPSDIQHWGYYGWNFIRACNIGLNNYNKADIPQSTIDKYAGEARLFRGWFYADKVSLFGDAPWFEKELNIDSEELYIERTPREEVMEKVLDDLKFACEKLPDDWGDGNAPGRLNRWAALQIKSRICLFEGTWRKYHGGSNADMWLNEAADAAKEIIENGPYSLYVTGDPAHDYNATHRATDDLAGNPEVLYWIRYKDGIKTNVEMDWYHVRAEYGGVTKSLVEDYLCTDGLPITISPLYQGDDVYENIFENRDPRLRQTILHPDDQAYYNYERNLSYSYPRLLGMQGNTLTSTGYHIIKSYNSITAGLGYTNKATPAIVLRLGEAMLNYAEAKAELGAISQADLDISINKLRNRVGMPHLDLNNIPIDPKYVNTGVTPLIVEIRRERRVELCMEGKFRYDDLRRWKQGKKLEIPSLGMRWDEANRFRFDPAGEATVKTTIVSGVEYIDVYQGTDWGNPVFDEGKHYLWPIPLNVISQNPNISQNPGWD
jgi:hypothetical protein